MSLLGVAELGLEYMLLPSHVEEENNTTVLSDTKSLGASRANSSTQSREKELMFLLPPSLKSQSNYKATYVRSHYHIYLPSSSTYISFSPIGMDELSVPW